MVSSNKCSYSHHMHEHGFDYYEVANQTIYYWSVMEALLFLHITKKISTSELLLCILVPQLYFIPF